MSPNNPRLHRGACCCPTAAAGTAPAFCPAAWGLNPFLCLLPSLSCYTEEAAQSALKCSAWGWSIIQGAPQRSALLSQPHESVLSHFMFKCHEWGEFYLNCVFKQKKKKFLCVLVPALKWELPSSVCSLRLEAAKWEIQCQEVSSVFEDIICECSAVNMTVAIDQSLWTSGLE